MLCNIFAYRLCRVEETLICLFLDGSLFCYGAHLPSNPVQCLRIQQRCRQLSRQPVRFRPGGWEGASVVCLWRARSIGTTPAVPTNSSEAPANGRRAHHDEYVASCHPQVLGHRAGGATARSEFLRHCWGAGSGVKGVGPPRLRCWPGLSRGGPPLREHVLRVDDHRPRLDALARGPGAPSHRTTSHSTNRIPGSAHPASWHHLTTAPTSRR